ncbi:PREDICTED: uncharacterized protein LOC106100420 [Papilio polytes]|uniref:uncharacterized protein LOC106100420 n=1 Tax=Papilio polytes TaxID=76194 RepID=UPI000676280A|nr:PREDICTED: uncharacterized protein LOC106100420 [Papilio polytes]
MATDEFQIQNIYRYSRKSFRNHQNSPIDNYAPSPREDPDSDAADSSPRNDIRFDEIRLATAGCSCDLDPETEIANILHKKCPVIALAQQQLQKLLDETDRFLCDNTRLNYKSPYDVVCLCKETLLNLNKWEYVIIILLLSAFLFGLIIGATSCKSQHGKFNSHLLTCIDNMLTFDSYTNDKSFRAIT